MSFKKLKKKIRQVIKDFLLILKSIFIKIGLKEIELPVNINISIIILGLIGFLRTVISIFLGIEYGSEIWFGYDFGVFFTMIVYPVFLCFFPAMVIDYFFSRWKIKVKWKNVLGLFFYLEFIHLFIPIFEWFQRIYKITPYFFSIPYDLYLIIVKTPLVASPLVFFFTEATTLGITIAWVFATIILIKYGLSVNAPLLKYLITLSFVFYIIYALTYPTYLLLRYNEESFYLGITYLMGAIGPIMYFKSKKYKEL